MRLVRLMCSGRLDPTFVLQALPVLGPQVELVCLAVGGLRLMERLAGSRRALLVDAWQTATGQPGRVQLLPLEALPRMPAGHLSSAHDTTLQAALRLGRSLGLDLPAEVAILAVETGPGFTFSEQLSPPVAAAVPVAARLVLHWLGGQVAPAERPGPGRSRTLRQKEAAE